MASREVSAGMVGLKSNCVAQRMYQVLEGDVDDVLKEDLIATEPLNIGSNPEVADSCEYDGLMAAIDVLG